MINHADSARAQPLRTVGESPKRLRARGVGVIDHARILRFFTWVRWRIRSSSAAWSTSSPAMTFSNGEVMASRMTGHCPLQSAD